ncbi:leucine-rich repeat protein [Leucobacter tenebrionis]|uniref:leucine-rich repeat protein n=1 Tax=Leucobacter tenebrionis TaxID=2873270 RepID=UPI001CA663C8|nr:leucine-rich repeat protein [Leucobacter tenebrionis]QZY53133.1 leucine-rich repeat protein [Leucobacter tenebrionis]
MRKTFEPVVEPNIIFDHVSKQFRIKHVHSLKQRVMSALKRQPIAEEFLAVNDLSFEVRPGESVALMGRNGSGKSTALKLLSGVLRPTKGGIYTYGRIVGLLEVGAGFHPDLTGRENIYLNAAILGMSRAETDARFDDIVEFAELHDFIDTEVKKYSSGMYARLGFSIAVHAEFDVLIVDEVLAVGDAEFRQKCNERLAEIQASGKTMFIVSHSAGQVKKLCDRGIVLDHGRKIFDGPVDTALELIKPKANTRIAGGLPYRELSSGELEFQKLPESTGTAHLNLYGSVEGKPVVSIGSYACAKLPIESAHIPEPVRTIDMGAFLQCTQLTEVSLPSTLRIISNGAFRGCSKLSSVVLPEGLEIIRTRAFASCGSLKSITVPRSVTTLEEGAFAANPNLVVKCYEGSLAAELLPKRLPASRLEVLK